MAHDAGRVALEDRMKDLQRTPCEYSEYRMKDLQGTAVSPTKRQSLDHMKSTKSSRANERNE